MNDIRIALFAGAVGCALGMQFPAPAAAQAVETVLHSFGADLGTDGVRPYASLVDVKGLLYGTTEYGGKHGYGAVFSLSPDGKTENAVYSFCSQKKCTDGEYPLAGLINVEGTLYGTTFEGGTNNSGAVFSLDSNSGAEQMLHAFGSGTDGARPDASLIDVNGVLYGTTQRGGASGKGTVFSLDPGTGTEQVVYSFCSKQKCADGQFPDANLINVNGTLYGTTQRGGAKKGGTVFSLDPDTGAQTVVYSFCSQQNCADGQFPLAGLIDVNGTLYGTTFAGGANKSYGAVFALDPGTGATTMVYSFCSQPGCSDGEYPQATLINVKGRLYGTTQGGGAHGYGTVFSITNP